MENIIWTLLALLIFAGLITLIYLLGKKAKLGFTMRVVIAFFLGISYGILVQYIFGGNSVGTEVVKWVNIIGAGFISALQFVVIPLVLVSIINAITKLNNPNQGLKKAGIIIGILLATTAISAVVTIGVVKVFGLSANNLIDYSPSSRQPKDVQSTILSLIPNNLFAALSSNSVLPIVFIAVLLGIAYLAISKERPTIGKGFKTFLETAYEFVMKIVDYVISFTPYGILGIIAVRTANGNWQFVLQLGLIITASFVAMAIVFLIHLAIMWIFGVNPIRYLKKTGAALLFAFTSRSSAATLPLTIEAQRKLGVSEANANLAGSFGTCIGQNACAGIYPVTVALLVGLVQGWNVWSASFLIPLVLYAVIASIGTAGIGGGATNVTLMVLGLMGLPIELVAILISVDFIIDMGRTLINVSDGIVAGFVTGRIEKDVNTDLLLDKISFEEVRKKELEAKHVAENI
jgi:hypothetical protein